MIRADWTPLWASCPSDNRKRLGPKQVAFLEFVREHGPVTHKELLDAGFGLPVRDSMTLTGRCYPELVDCDTGYPQRYFIAAPGHLRALEAALAAVRAGKNPYECTEHWSGIAVDHLLNTGVIRDDRDRRRYCLADPPYQENRVAREIRKKMTCPQAAVPACLSQETTRHD